MFEKRIDTAACEFIELQDDECDVYRGAGLALAVESDGKLAELFYAGETSENDWKVVLNRAFEERVWLVLCSTYTLCDPVLIDPKDPTSFAHAMRVYGENDNT